MGGLPLKKTMLYFIIFALFGGALFVSYPGGWDLWNPDKPSFPFWLIAGAAKGLGARNGIAARLPLTFFGLCTLNVDFCYSTRLFGERAGPFSALMFSTSREFL
jgi:4-amino-4-deoxy-L-arabinose transferase-like glycosyltransferase